MKKQFLLIMAGGLLTFAACNTGNPENGASQAQIDSMVNARVEQIRTDMMSKNDSMINVMAQMKADSMIAAMKGEPAKTTTKTSAHKAETHTAPASTNTAPASEPATGKSKFQSHSDQNQTQSGLDRLKSHSDQNQKQTGLERLKSHADQKK